MTDILHIAWKNQLIFCPNRGLIKTRNKQFFAFEKISQQVIGVPQVVYDTSAPVAALGTQNCLCLCIVTLCSFAYNKRKKKRKNTLIIPHCDLWGWQCFYDCSYFFPHLSFNILINRFLVKEMSVHTVPIQRLNQTWVSGLVIDGEVFSNIMGTSATIW